MRHIILMVLLLVPLTLSAHSPEEFLDVIEETKKSVVFVVTTPKEGTETELPAISPEEDVDPDNKRGKFTGTGFIVEGGYIVTNWHVINNYELVEVYLENDPRPYPVTVIGSDADIDIAVLQVDDTFPKDLPRLKWRTDELRVGAEIWALGHPNGLTYSVSKGIVSHTNRRLESPWQPTIQIDAAINHGNSGGPLLDMNGDVVGINVMLISRVGEFNGLGLAIDGDVAKRATQTLIEYGTINRPLMGVMLGYDKDTYQVVAQEVVDGGAADTAGVKADDLYLEIDGIKIVLVDDVFDILATKRPFDTVNIKVSRDGDTKTFEVTLGSKLIVED